MKRRSIVVLLFFCFSVLSLSQSRTLDYYLQEGIKNSPLLKDYYNQVSSALLDSLLIRSSKMPQVEAKSQLLYSPVFTNFGYDEVVTDGGNYQAVVSVSQNILNKREISNKFQAIDIQKQGAYNSTKLSVAEIKKIITEQYLISCADYNDLSFNKSFLELYYKENKITYQFVLNGLCKQTDYLSLQVETQSLEILVNQLKNQYETDMRLLNQLCGLNDTGFYDLNLPALEITGMAEISKSPLFMQYKIDSLRIVNDIAGIDMRYLPKMNWFADAGFLTATPFNFYRHFGFSAGINLSIPVYDGNQKEKEKQKLKLAENTRSSYLDNFTTRYYQQIQQLNSELKSFKNLEVQLQNQLATSEQLVNALRQQLESGVIQMTEYINAVKNYRSVTKTLSDNRIRILQVINEINFLLTQ
ncbi:MAG: TolC family protein [Bacteroidia bacterium]|nr:TolC family protein [Bacteroidia bacterium]